MVLLIDLANDRLAFGATDGRSVRWLEFSPARGCHGPLSKALDAFGFRRRPPTAVVLMEQGGEGRPRRDVSWSLVRAGVALANTLAFSWNVPVVKMTGQPADPRELAAAVWQLASRAGLGDWAAAAYSGEPNITKPRNII